MNATGQTFAPATRELRAINLTVTLAERPVLAHVGLTVTSGQWLNVTGPAGSGKSLLLQILAGLRPPTEGQVLIDGHPVGPGTPGANPGILLQTYGLHPVLTAAETVSLPLQLRRLPHDQIRLQRDTWLDALGLRAAADQLVTNLSGGQRQRVALARALATNAAFLLLVPSPLLAS
jgi:ABC-type nitrate/sulfonate/bicarbonate transport system ATPase subunit